MKRRRRQQVARRLDNAIRGVIRFCAELELENLEALSTLECLSRVYPEGHSHILLYRASLKDPSLELTPVQMCSFFEDCEQILQTLQNIAPDLDLTPIEASFFGTRKASLKALDEILKTAK